MIKGFVNVGDKTPTNEDEEWLGTSPGSPASVRTALSGASSRGTFVSQGGHVYRNARPYRKNTHPRYVCTIRVKKIVMH